MPSQDTAEDIIAQLRADDYDRFLCIQLAPPAKRGALYAIAALHSELARIAESVSEPLLGHIRLAWWREALDEIEAGHASRNHPVVLAIAELLQAQPGLLPLLREPVDARAADLDASLIAQRAAWLNYLDHTAGALHRAWALVVDAPAAQAHDAALRAQARAFAMLGLARAIPYLHSQGFLRFDHARMNAHGLTSLAPSPSLMDLVQALVAEASIEAPPLSASLRPLTGLARLGRLHARMLKKASFNPYILRPYKASSAWVVARTYINL